MNVSNIKLFKPYGLTRRLVKNNFGNHPYEIILKMKIVRNKLRLRYFIDDETFSDYLNNILISLNKSNINYENFDLKKQILNYITEESKYVKYYLINRYFDSIINDVKPVSIQWQYFSMKDNYDLLFYHLLLSYV